MSLRSFCGIVPGLLILSLGIEIHAQTSAYFQAVTNLNPAGYWPMHEVEASVPGDIETNYGTLGVLGTGYYPDWVGGAWTNAFKRQFPGALAGDADKAVYFTEPASNSGGPTNSLYVPHWSPLSTLTPPFSVECWFYATNNNEGDIWSQCGYEGFNDGASGGGGGNVCGIRLYWGGPGFTVYSYNDSSTLNSVNANGSYTIGHWYHVVVTDDGNYINLFVNGSSVTNHNQPANLYAPDFWTPFEVGNGRGNTRAVKGIVDEVAIYTNIISDISAHYAAGTNHSPNPTYFQLVTNDHPVVYLRMDSPSYAPPPAATWPVLKNYGMTNGVAVGNGVYTPGTLPGIMPGPASAGGGPFGGLAVPGGTNVPALSGISSFADAGFARVYNPTGQTPFSVTAMFRGNPCDNRFQNIVGHSDNSWRIAMNTDGALQCTMGTNSSSVINSLGTYNDGNWHQVVEVYTPNSNLALTGTNALYVDGLLDSQVTAVSTIGISPGSPLDVMIGADPQYTNNAAGPGRQFAGQVCEVAFFTNALTSSQVQALYTAAVVPPEPPQFLSEPSNTTVVELWPATFSATVTGNPAPAFQWYINGSEIPSATNSSYTLPNAALAENGAALSLVASSVVTNVSFSVTSSPAILSVTAASQPPVLLGAQSLGLIQVEVSLSTLITLATATNLSNYSLSGPGGSISILGATQDATQSNVVLTVAGLADQTSYVLTVNNLSAQTVQGDIIASNSTANFISSAFVPITIGSSISIGGQMVTNYGLTVTSSGAAIGGTNDQFQFSGEQVSGNFDISVRVASLNLSDTWAKAGLMARESLAPAGRFASSLATPSMNGCFFEWRDPAGSASQSAGNFPANYPNTWLRLNRIGNVFSGYASYDGQTWTLLSSQNITLSNELYLGFVVDSDETNTAVSAQFLQITNTPATAVIGTETYPYEPLAACSRKTPIVFSEIMWKPAPRTDGKNLEYVEIYNSNPWFQDISGYQISCADMNYTFPTNTTIAGGAYLVIAAAPSDMESIYGITNVSGPYNGSLKHAETLELLDEVSNVLLTVPYSDVYPWPVATGGTGHSLILANPSYGEGDPRAWAISDVVGGSPGTMESFHPSPLRNVVINEILPHSENPAVPQFIELYNHSTNNVDVSGCILTDDPTTNKFVIPSGTVISPAGFVSFTQPQFGFTLNGAGETLYFIKPDGSRVLDAVQFGPQADGVSFGRWPDGANDFYAFATNTPGTNNSTILIGNIVINELMYDPISGSDDDQYIELYNQGTNTVNLAGWQFTAGVTFVLPSVSLAPNGYLVVARNLTNLLAKYTNLSSGNLIGNYSGKLSHDGELVELAQPESFYGTNTILVAEDEVAYGTGGRWGEWSSGGGSSLELIDPHANHRLAANWADSNDTSKSVWTNITATGVLDNGANYESSILHAQIGILDVGECLVDNIQVLCNGTNCVLNPNFQNGTLANWSLQGDHVRSSLDTPGYNSNYALHMRSSDKVWTGDDSCQMALATNTLASGQTATLSFEARWLHGWPEALLRLNGNWLEAAGAMPVPQNLGSPGMPNSTYITNAGPAIYNVTHTPSLPAAGQPAVVTANVSDPDGVANLTLYYRIDPATTYTAVPMKDNGTGGDAVPGDGVFSATIPGQAANQIVAFYISATDGLGATTRFPALRPNDNEPVRECVIMFGDSNPGGSFGVYHLWVTQTNSTRWANLGNLSNEGNDATFVYANRVIYNMQGHFAGSPYHQDFTTPAGALCHYKWIFNDDDQFLGTTSFNKIHQPGNGPGDDASLQREQLANTFLRALGVPWLNRRYVAVYVNGNRRDTLMEDAQVPDGDVIKEHYPNDSDGFLYKMQPWFEFAPQLSGETMSFDNENWCTLNEYTTTGGVKKTGRYRFNYEVRRTPDSDNDFTNVYSLVDAANSSGTPNAVANLEDMANMENWMRVFAANHAAGNWDSFGAENGQNLYGYIGTEGTRYSLHMWDFNIVLGNSSSWGPGQNLFYVNPSDPFMIDIYETPAFRRMYWRAMQELVNGPLNLSVSGPLLMAKYNAFVANGLSGIENPATHIEPWLSVAQSSIAAQLAEVNASAFVVNSTMVISNNVAYLTGVAPVNLDTVLINGASYPLTWTSLTGWTIAVPLVNGTNNLNIVGMDRKGQPISGDAGNVAVTYNGTNSSPVGQVVINEIMYNPVVPDSQFVELYNNSTNVMFDLSGWQVPALDYTFPGGSVIGPANYLVLAANDAAFAGAYGATNPIFDTFAGAMQPGQLLSLIQPETGSTNELTVAQVEYDSALPWPTNANGTGASLQLIDPQQDNWRVGNWSITSYISTPGASNSVAASLAPFPSLWINEVQPNNLTGITNSAGQHSSWVELFNPGTNAVSLNGLYLANNYTNLLQWAFPSNTLMGAGRFAVIFADGETNLSTTNELHASFVLPSGTGSLALTRLATNGQQQVLDYVNYANISPNDSYGSYPDGQCFFRQEFFAATPGASNNASVVQPPSFVDYAMPGSVYTQNFDSLPDPGATSVNANNPVTINGITYSLANPYDFAFPTTPSGNSGGLGIAAMAGWYGSSVSEAQFGATDGDQTTGGQISFGPANGSNRALGLLATSSTKGTTFGVRLINGTGQTLNFVNLQYTGEVWRQSNVPKTLQFYYFLDQTGTYAFPDGTTAFVPALNVNFPTVTGDSGGVAVDGTSSINQTNLSVTNLAIASWPPGAALWLMWQMTDSTGKAQGLAIDNLRFSASVLPVGFVAPAMTSAMTSGTNFSLTCPTVTGLSYQLEYNSNLAGTNWLPVGTPVAGTGNPATFNMGTTNSQLFFRVQIQP